MGDIVTFENKFSLQNTENKVGLLLKCLSLRNEFLEDAQQGLENSRELGRRTSRVLEELRASLLWTRNFCDRCAVASENDSLDEMIRARDQLRLELSQKNTCNLASILRNDGIKSENNACAHRAVE